MGKDDDKQLDGGLPPAGAPGAPKPSAIAPGAPNRIAPPVVPPDSEYLTYQQPATRGTLTMLVNGRYNNGGTYKDLTEPLDAMQSAIESLGSGDRLYLSAWFFNPSTPLTRTAVGGAKTWGELLAAQAAAGVIVRMLINDFDPVSTMDTWLQDASITPLDDLLGKMQPSTRDNLKYIVSRQGAFHGFLKTLGTAASQGDKNFWHYVRYSFVGSHHQKFMVLRQDQQLTAFCGGVDLEMSKVPSTWSPGAMFNGWHDVHVKLVGPITHDLEREFVMRWNRDRDGSRRAPLKGCAGLRGAGPHAAE
jgi:phosphatidylserine/phosphatidylglycerophosphate/cardiolipin synthase-like enzyme